MKMRLPQCCAGLAVVLAGCGHGPSTRFYVLSPVGPAGATAGAVYRGAPIRVIAVHVPPTLDRPELVRSIDADEVALRDFDRWAAPLGDLARQALTQDLLDRLPPGAVLFPDVQTASVHRDLVLDILAFSQTHGVGVLDISWTLLAPPGSSRPLTGTVRLTAPALAAGAEGEAELLSRLLAQAADQIARDIRQAD
jgi:uncharacterized lipoprotein YmbA